MNRRRLHGTRGFTLLEMLVAMTIFAIISVGIGFALVGAGRAQVAVTTHGNDMREARAILARIGEDIRWAYASADTPTTEFVASGNAQDSLITLTTLTHRVQGSPTGQSNPVGGTGVTDMQDVNAEPPQSCVSLVTYKLDAQSHELTRSETDVPPSQVVPMTDPVPVTLSRRVTSVTLEFTDSTGSARTDWDYETQLQSTTGTGTPAGSTSVTQGQLDTTLPIVAKITVEIMGSNGQPLQLSSSVAISMPTPQPTGQKPARRAASLPRSFGTRRLIAMAPPADARPRFAS